MEASVSVLLVTVCTAFAHQFQHVAASAASLHAADSPSSAVQEEYIVVLNEGLSDFEVENHKMLVRNLSNTSGVMYEYHIGKSFRGYSVKMDKKLHHVVRAMNYVKYTEKIQVVHATNQTVANCTLQRDATWGIIRTTMRGTPFFYYDYIYNLDSAGDGIDAYIIDSGIETSHPEFGGRAKWGIDFVDYPSPKTDLNGHGTHVAGIVMSNTWGVAKKATAIAVRVLDRDGFGTTAGIIAGVEWVANRHLNRSGRRSVVNMSVGSYRSFALDDAVNAAADVGLHIAVAAGNSWQNACYFSPAAARKSVTVAASDRYDVFAWFSNWGNCVDIIAPGVSVTSTWKSKHFLCGVMAKILSDEKSITTDDMKELLKNTATVNKVIEIPDSSTPNALVFKDCT